MAMSPKSFDLFLVLKGLAKINLDGHLASDFAIVELLLHVSVTWAQYFHAPLSCVTLSFIGLRVTNKKKLNAFYIVII